MTLFPIIDQKTNLALLQNVVRNRRIANAYLFHGEDGSGTEAVALEFAGLLNCTDDTEPPCGICPACRAMRNLEHPNLTLIFPIPIHTDDASEDPFKKLREEEVEELQEAISQKAVNPYSKILLKRGLHIPINSIRQLSRTVYLTQAAPGQKVVIIFDAHLMQEPAANAFLKILEEPPTYTTFILTTSNPNQLLPTIRSRCQALFFPPIPPDVLETNLLEKSNNPADVRLVAYLAAGDVLTAERLLENNLGEIKNTIQQIWQALLKGDIPAIYQLTNALSQIGRVEPDYFKQLMRALLFWIRDMQLLQHQADQADLIFREFSTTMTASVQKLPALDYHQMKSAVENCIDFLNRNVYINLALLEMFFNLRDCIKSGIRNV